MYHKSQTKSENPSLEDSDLIGYMSLTRGIKVTL